MLSIQGTISLTRDGTHRLAVSIELQEGESALLVGANGSGKTTVLDIAAGVRTLDEGNVTNGHMNSPIGYAVQEPSAGLLPWQTILGNILLPNMIHGTNFALAEKNALGLLETFGLRGRADDYPYRLSGGEKQIVNLIRALCTPCSILLLDEVLTSLHQDARTKATSLLSAFIPNKTSIVVTHNVNDLALPFTRCYAIRNSRVIEIEASKAREAVEDAL